MLAVPQSGNNILTWARQATKEINSNIIQNGIGVKVNRTLNGTNLVVQPGDKSKPSNARLFMPFDALLHYQTEKSSAIVVRVLTGNLYYGLGNYWSEIPQANLTGDYWDVSVSVADGLTLGIICDYSSSSSGEGPESFHVGIIPSLEEASSSGYQDAWVDNEGLHYYPLVRFVDGTNGYDGPYVFSVTVEDGQTEKKFYAVQCYHGDVFFDFNGAQPFVAEIVSGENGRYSINVVGGTGVGSGWIDVVEIATAATFPSGSRVIAHPIFVTSLASGSTQSS